MWLRLGSYAGAIGAGGSVSSGGSDPGLGRGARAAGAGGGSGYNGEGSEAQGHGRDGSRRDWGGEEMV